MFQQCRRRRHSSEWWVSEWDEERGLVGVSRTWRCEAGIRHCRGGERVSQRHTTSAGDRDQKEEERERRGEGNGGRE